MNQPWSEQVEKAVLSCALNGEADQVVARCTKDDFWRAQHKDIFEAILGCRRNGQEADLVGVQNYLTERNKLDVVSLFGLDAEFTPVVSRTAQYVDQLKDYTVRRRIVSTAQWMIKNVGEEEGAGVEIWSRAYAKMDGIVDDADTGEPEDMATLAEKYGLEIVQRKEGEDTGIASGFDKLDRVILGLAPSRFHIIAGRPGMGKSMFSQNIAQHVAVRGGGRVVFFSLEMSEKEVYERLLASESGVPFKALRRGTMGNKDRLEVQSAINSLEKSGLFVDDSPSMSVYDIVQKSRRLHQIQPLDLIVVDYIGLLRVHGDFESHTLAVGDITRALKMLAKELNIPVIALSQLSRRCEQRDDKRPQLSDLRDSGAIEQDADIVIFVYRDSVYNPETPESEAEVIVAKHRGGETGSIGMRFDGARMRFMDGTTDYGSGLGHQFQF